MRLTVALFASGLPIVLAADSITAAIAPASPNTGEIAKCLKDKSCDMGDSKCVCQCVTCPYPNEDQANETTKCVTACPKGSGHGADLETYTSCMQGCISNHFYASSVGTPQQTAGSGDNAGTNGNAVPTTEFSGASEPEPTGTDPDASTAEYGSGSKSTSTEAGLPQTFSSQTSGIQTVSIPAASTSKNAGALASGLSGAFLSPFVVILALLLP